MTKKDLTIHAIDNITDALKILSRIDWDNEKQRDANLSSAWNRVDMAARRLMEAAQ